MLFRAIIGGSAAALLIAALSFSACSGMTRERTGAARASSASVSEPQAGVPARSVASADLLDAGVSDAASAPPMASRDCKDPGAIILNHPDGGVVFNNAMTSVDAGFIDRSQGVIDAVAQQATSYRCCFDAWMRDHSEVETKLLLRLTLAANGDVLDAEVDERRSSEVDDATRNCVLEVARDTTFPASPTGKQTTVEYPFRLGAASR